MYQRPPARQILGNESSPLVSAMDRRGWVYGENSNNIYLPNWDDIKVNPRDVESKQRIRKTAKRKSEHGSVKHISSIAKSQIEKRQDLRNSQRDARSKLTPTISHANRIIPHASSDHRKNNNVPTDTDKLEETADENIKNSSETNDDLYEFQPFTRLPPKTAGDMLRLEEEQKFWQSKLEGENLDDDDDDDLKYISLNQENKAHHKKSEYLTAVDWFIAEIARFSEQIGTDTTKKTDTAISIARLYDMVSTTKSDFNQVFAESWEHQPSLASLPSYLETNDKIRKLWLAIEELLHEFARKDMARNQLYRENLRNFHMAILQFREQRQKLRVNMELEIQERSVSGVRDLEIQFEERLRKQDEESRRNIQELEREKNTLEDQLRAQIEKCAQTEIDLMRRMEQEKSNIRVTLENELKRAQKKWSEEKNTIATKHQREIYEMQEKHTAQLDTVLRENTERSNKTDSQMDLLREEIHTLHKTLDTTRTNFHEKQELLEKNLKAGYEKKINEIVSKMKQLEQNHEDFVHELESAHSKKTHGLRLEFHMQLESARLRLEKQTAESDAKEKQFERKIAILQNELQVKEKAFIENLQKLEKEYRQNAITEWPDLHFVQDTLPIHAGLITNSQSEMHTDEEMPPPPPPEVPDGNDLENEDEDFSLSSSDDDGVPPPPRSESEYE